MRLFDLQTGSEAGRWAAARAAVATCAWHPYLPRLLACGSGERTFGATEELGQPDCALRLWRGVALGCYLDD